MIDWESIPWCNKFNKAIDNKFVDEIASKCYMAELYNGCGKCLCQTQKEILKVKGSKRKVREGGEEN